MGGVSLKMENNKSGVSYTPDQEKAIKIRDTNLLVSAAAGSGKTMVLVDRIVDIMLKEKIDIENFLIVTFTNAAASQMAEKIRDKLLSCLGSDDDRFIRSQLKNLGSANISTMHSFCIDILRKYYEFLGISPSFSIVNNATGAVIKAKAMERTLEEEYGNEQEDFNDLYHAYGRLREENIIEMVDGIYSSIQTQIHPLAWLDSAIANENSYVSLIISHIKGELKTCISQLNLALSLSREEDGPYKYEKDFQNDIGNIEKVLDLAQIESYDQMISSLNSIDFPRISTISKKDLAKGIDENKKNLAKAIRDDVKDTVNKKLKGDFGTKTLNQLEYENKLGLSYLKTITRLIKSYDKNLRSLKEEENVLSFADVEHLCLKALSNEEIKSKVRDKVKYIFYDEYQDINPLQEEIISMIEGDTNLFFVGDIKQSIYKFRLADPSLFIRRHRDYSEGGNGKVINLSENFRSSPHILNYLNFIFKDLMTPDLGEIDYKSEGQSLSWTSASEARTGSVKLVLNEKSQDTSYYDLEDNALFIAEEIQKLIGEGRSYRDIVVLMRNVKNRISKYEDAFEAYGIPYYSDVSNISLESPEVSIAIDFLKIINNFKNDNCLLSLMLNPIGGFTEDDLSRIRASADKKSFSKALEAYSEEDELKTRVDGFIGKIKFYREELKRMKLSEFLYYILADTGYLAYIGAGYMGEEKLQNILAFIERVEEYENSSYASLPSFLTYVDTLLNSPSESLEPTKLLSEADNVVRIMTIHKSKGLEFPIVFMTDMEREIRLMEKNDTYIVDNELGVGLTLKDLSRGTSYKTAHRKLIDSKKEKENLSEEVRLFYVGTTRAEEVLYLVGSHKDPQAYLEALAYQPLDLSLLKARSMMDWYMTSSIRDRAFYKDISSFVEVKNVSTYLKDPDAFTLKLRRSIKKSKNNSNMVNLFKLVEQENYETDNLLPKVFNYTYPDEESTQRPFKTTVSELSAKNRYKTDDTADFPKIFKEKSPLLDKLPDILKSDQSMTALSKGSLVHFVFQNLSYRVHTLESLGDELERMVMMDLITNEEKNLLVPEKFLSFFNSSLGKRALANLGSLEREKAFTMKVDKLYIDGQIDAFFIENGEIVMYDFKTDISISKTRYRDQMLHYKAALEMAYNIPVKETYIYWTEFSRSMLLEI